MNSNWGIKEFDTSYLRKLPSHGTRLKKSSARDPVDPATRMRREDESVLGGYGKPELNDFFMTGKRIPKGYTGWSYFSIELQGMALL